MKCGSHPTGHLTNSYVSVVQSRQNPKNTRQRVAEQSWLTGEGRQDDGPRPTEQGGPRSCNQQVVTYAPTRSIRAVSQARSQSHRSSKLPPFCAAIASRGFAFHFHLLSLRPIIGCSPSPNDQTPTPVPECPTHSCTHTRRPAPQPARASAALVLALALSRLQVMSGKFNFSNCQGSQLLI